MTRPRTTSPSRLLTLGLLVMAGLLLVREFVPEHPRIALIKLRYSY